MVPPYSSFNAYEFPALLGCLVVLCCFNCLTLDTILHCHHNLEAGSRLPGGGKMVHGRSGRLIVVVLPQSLAELVRGLGPQKHVLIDTLSSLLENGRVAVDQLPSDPLKCKAEKVSKVMLRATSGALDILRRFAENMTCLCHSLCAS